MGFKDFAAGIGSVAGSALGGPLGGAVGAGIGQGIQDEEARKRLAADWQKNADLQKEFAQHGIRWKVEDAERAGIHPLVGLGAQTHSASPMSAGGDIGGSAMAEMGQNVSRAINSTRTAEERQLAQLQLANARADLDGKTIDNQIRASQLQKMNQVGPPLPSPMDSNMIEGQGDSRRGVKLVPSQVTASLPGVPGVQAGAINSLQYVRTSDGNYTIAPSEQSKERTEDDFIGETLWHIKNRINPPPPDPKMFPLPKGYDRWEWNNFKQEFIPVSDRGSSYERRLFKYRMKKGGR